MPARHPHDWMQVGTVMTLASATHSAAARNPRPRRNPRHSPQFSIRVLRRQRSHAPRRIFRAHFCTLFLRRRRA